MLRRRRPFPRAPRGPAGKAARCRCCPRPPSAPSRRPARSARPARPSRRASGRPSNTRPSAARRSRAPSASRRRSAWTCWSTASASGTTWSSISASSSTGSPSPATAGCRATARGASSRRSSIGDVRAAAAHDRLLEPVRPVAHHAADEGHAHRADHDPAMVVRARRPAAARHGLPDRPGHPRRGDRPGGGRHRRHPDRRAGPARGPAAGRGAVGRLPALGGRCLPPDRRGRPRRDADPHPHVLLRVQRHHRRRSPRWTPT